MTGRSSVDLAFGQVLWPDSEIESIYVDYDAVSIKVLESTGSTKIVRARGYIGYSVIGFWDEVVIERAELFAQHPFIDACRDDITRRLGTIWTDSGCPSRNGRSWLALLVHLSDGSVIQVAAADLEVLAES
jgi:hypothetical protein